MAALLALHAPFLAQVDNEVTTDGVAIFEALLISAAILIAMSFVSKAVATRQDRDWLPTMIMWACAAKLLGAFGRYWMVTELYQTGDSYSYHMWGGIFAQVWRGMQVPVSQSSQPGTAFTEIATGLIYAPYTPSMLGGFIIFALIAFSKSGGMVSSSACFQAFQVPDSFAALTATRPAAVISPAASSRSTRALFNADQRLSRFRGVNTCM